MQIACRILQRLDRIERIGQAAPIRRLRHELRNALGAFGAHGLRIEATFLPDHAGEEFDRKPIRGRVLFDGAADIVGGRRGVWRSGFFGWGRLALNGRRTFKRLRIRRPIQGDQRANHQSACRTYHFVIAGLDPAIRAAALRLCCCRAYNMTIHHGRPNQAPAWRSKSESLSILTRTRCRPPLRSLRLLWNYSSWASSSYSSRIESFV